MDAGTLDLALPAFALIAQNGSLERSTDSFRRWHDRVPGQLRELEQVLGGERDRADLGVDGASITLQAVMDPSGSRAALVTVVPFGCEGSADPIAVLADRLASSPAIAWLKDLEGRHLCINRPYTEQLGTSEERLHGRRDDELSPRETVDGPRLASGIADGEPTELEYTVAPYEGRPGLAVLRFAVRDREQRAIATCGVAAPLSDSHLAEEECVSLLQLERLCRLDPGAARAQLLSDWGLGNEAPPPREDSAPPSPIESGDGVAYGTMVFESEVAPAGPTELERQLQQQLAELQQESAVNSRDLQELGAELARERERRGSLERELAEMRTNRPHEPSPVADAGAAVESLRAQLAERASEVEGIRTELAAARAALDGTGRELAEKSGALDSMRAELAETSRALEAAQADTRRVGAPAPAAIPEPMPAAAPEPVPVPEPMPVAAPEPEPVPAAAPDPLPMPAAAPEAAPATAPPAAAPTTAPPTTAPPPSPAEPTPPPPPKRGLFARLAGRGRR